jgi:hypothetical protein
MECLFIEIEPFTRKVVKLGLEDDLRALQDLLRRNPAAGTRDPGTCGLRKVRMADSARRRGKSSGARVHYLYVPHRRTIYLVHLYVKADQGTLTPEQKRILCAWTLRMATE